jgi:hypothetical protein
MLFTGDDRALLITGAAGFLVGLMVLMVAQKPRFSLLLPVFRCDRRVDPDLQPDPLGFHFWSG